MAALDEELPDWAALVAAMTLVDGALSVVLASFASGSFEPARNRVPKMLAEEEFHSSLAAAWYKRLAGTEGEALELLAGATRRMLPTILAWVGASDDAARSMVEAGVIGSAEQRLSAFRDAARDLTSLAGVDVDSAEASDEWDTSRGRTTGCPNQESVERARGDRNRALFVE